MWSLPEGYLRFDRAVAQGHIPGVIDDATSPIGFSNFDSGLAPHQGEAVSQNLLETEVDPLLGSIVDGGVAGHGRHERSGIDVGIAKATYEDAGWRRALQVEAVKEGADLQKGVKAGEEGTRRPAAQHFPTFADETLGLAGARSQRLQGRVQVQGGFFAIHHRT